MATASCREKGGDSVRVETKEIELQIVWVKDRGDLTYQKGLRGRLQRQGMAETGGSASTASNLASQLRHRSRKRRAPR